MVTTTIVSGLVLAFVSGLTFVAYKHPKGYRFIAIYILSPLLIFPLAFCLIKIGGIVYYIGFLRGCADKATEDTVNVSVSSIQGLHQNFTELAWVFGISIAFVVFGAFLCILPIILSDDDTIES